MIPAETVPLGSPLPTGTLIGRSVLPPGVTSDVEPPSPPELEPIGAPADDSLDAGDQDFRREELATYLHDGAWDEAFEEWWTTSDLEEQTLDLARDLEMFARFDFFWDDFAGRVGFHAPGVPEDWRERELHPDLDSWGTVSALNAGLAEFGQLVSEVLTEEYVEWEADPDVPDDLPDF